MKKPITMVDLKKSYLVYKGEIDAAVSRVLESGWYLLGPEVSAFEDAFGQWCSAKHCIGVANGTDAITISLRALGIESGDAVFTVSHTAVATVAAVRLAGATPVLVDVDSQTFTIDPARLEAAVRTFLKSGSAGRPKAVIAVHLYGQVCDMVALRSICDRYDLYLLEDCAQAHGATDKGVRVGTFGDVSAFSFYPTKNLGAFGDGGAIVTNDTAIAERCRALRQYGWFKHFQSDIEGMNSRLDELQAAILNVRLGHLEEEIAIRRKFATIYNEGLRKSVVIPEVRAGTQHSFHLYVIRSHQRDRIAFALKERGIATAIHYPTPVHQQKAYKGRLPEDPAGLLVTERLSSEILSLPLQPFLAEQDIERVVEEIASVTTEQFRHGH